jgi:DNA polymerase III delta prime subunit
MSEAMNNRVIILEGPDGAGKTTLADLLANYHGFVRWHTNKPSRNEYVFKTYTDLLIKALNHDQPVVFDRLHLGETIYGPVMRGKDLLGPLGVRLINRVIVARDVKFVICLPDKWLFRHIFNTRGDDYIKQYDKASDIYDMYLDYAKTNVLDVYNYTEMNESSRNRLLFAPQPSLPVGCVGNPNARWLIVGEAVNHKVLQHDLPFHQLANSSLFLNHALTLTHNQENHFAFTNAYLHGTTTQRDLKVIVDRMPKFRNAVALGRIAERVCKNFGIEYQYVEHPSAAKRFKFQQMSDYKFQQMSDYANKLKEAMR